MKKIDHSLEASINGITPLSDAEKALIQEGLSNQTNPPNDIYERDFVNSSIDG